VPGTLTTVPGERNLKPSPPAAMARPGKNPDHFGNPGFIHHTSLV